MAKQQSDVGLLIQSQNYKGARTPVRIKSRCYSCNPWRIGYLYEEEPDHDNCTHEHAWFDKLWLCGCECNKDWVPQDVGDPSQDPPSKKKKRGQDEVRDVRDDADSGSTSSVSDSRGDLPESDGPETSFSSLERHDASSNDDSEEEGDEVPSEHEVS